MKVYHNFGPVFDKNSKVLILGSFPSVKSRKENFYYMHPQNRFWKVMASIFNEEIIDKKNFILKHNLALWDVVYSCDIEGSKDSSIKNVIPNDIKYLLDNSCVKYVFTLGRKSYDLYNKLIYEKTKIKSILLSSTSPMNASKSLNDLENEFLIIKECLEK